MHRYLCFKVKPIYVRVDHFVKGDFALEIMKKLSKLDPPGRFVELIEGTEVVDCRCFLVAKEQAIEKTCQALREKKNGCPCQLKSVEGTANKSKGAAPFALTFSKERIRELQKHLEAKFHKSFKVGSKKKTLFGAKANDIHEADAAVVVDGKNPKCLTARQAIIESIQEAKQPAEKKAEVVLTTNAEVVCKPSSKKRMTPELKTPPRPTKKAKTCPEAPPKARKDEAMLKDIKLIIPEPPKRILPTPVKENKTSAIKAMPMPPRATIDYRNDIWKEHQFRRQP